MTVMTRPTTEAEDEWEVCECSEHVCNRLASMGDADDDVLCDECRMGNHDDG